ncbi:MAG: alpha/beta hydrolase [Hyphomicrobiaceae bacterium]|nr:alpha/beta hydrolase [Hyphomicrobiaceae bacterium]
MTRQPDPARVGGPLCDLLVEHGDGPGLAVMLHAAGTGPRALDRLAGLIAPVVGRTAAPAFERDGRSIIGPGAEPFAAAVALARSLIEVGGEGPRVLLGHSMGGLIALQTLLDGVRADAAILFEPIVLSVLDPADPVDCAALDWDAAVVEGLRASYAAGDLEAGVARFIEAYGALPWGLLPAPARADLVRRAPTILAEANATNAAQISREALARIPVPVLVLDGDRSPNITQRMTRRLAAILPAAEHRTIAGAGHMGPLTSPRPVAEAITAFLVRHIRRG